MQLLRNGLTNEVFNKCLIVKIHNKQNQMAICYITKSHLCSTALLVLKAQMKSISNEFALRKSNWNVFSFFVSWCDYIVPIIPPKPFLYHCLISWNYPHASFISLITILRIKLNSKMGMNMADVCTKPSNNIVFRWSP